MILCRVKVHLANRVLAGVFSFPSTFAAWKQADQQFPGAHRITVIAL